MKKVLFFIVLISTSNRIFSQIQSPETNEIDEVKIKYKPTGNLQKDLSHYGDSKPVKNMKSELAHYIHNHSDPKIMKPGPRDFVQPKGEGFLPTYGIKNKWDDTNLEEFLLKELGEDFFTKDLKIKKLLVYNFIFFVFRHFERKEILKYGYCSEIDISRFVQKAEKDAVEFNAQKL